MNNTDFIAIIPARYNSTRFPGKPLAMLGEMTVIHRVYNQVKKALDNVVVATDNQLIADEVHNFGGTAVITRPDHPSGTDRCFEAYNNIQSDAKVIVNIQGDEPFIQPEQIQALTACFDNPETDIATLIRPFDPNLPFEQLENPNTPKVVVDNNGKAIYFSRSVIPFIRGAEKQQWPQKHNFYTHIGLYAYRAEALLKITQLQPSTLEKAESLEQLRWLQNGLHIQTAISNHTTIGIDTPEDLQRAIQFLKHHD